MKRFVVVVIVAVCCLLFHATFTIIVGHIQHCVAAGAATEEEGGTNTDIMTSGSDKRNATGAVITTIC